VHDLDYQLAIGDTYLFTSNVVNSFRISASRTNIVKLPDNYASWRTFGANYTPIGGNIVDTAITGGLGFNVGTSASVPGASHNGPNPSITDEVSWVKGSHQFMFGGNAYWQEMNYWSGLNAVGTMTFNGSTGTGLGMTDMLLGLPSGFGQGTAYGFYNRQWYLSMYAQDTWKASRHLTINYGVRWEPYLGQYNKWGQIHDVIPSLFAADYHSPVFTNAPAGVIFPGDPNYPCGKSFQCDDWHKFLPRVGLAWDPVGDGKKWLSAPATGCMKTAATCSTPTRCRSARPLGITSRHSSQTCPTYGPRTEVCRASRRRGRIRSRRSPQWLGWVRPPRTLLFPREAATSISLTRDSSRCTPTNGIWPWRSKSTTGCSK
jgi:hypothetical protein